MKNNIQKNRKNKFALIVTSGILLLQMCFFSVAQAGLLQEIEGEISGGLGDAADWLGVDLGGGGPTTSFSGFQGGLQAPSTEGYAGGLTKATDARTYILNVTNFALGFLGLIAVIVIIYGGFMYVTAAGEQEKAEKGKKSVTYAIMGIILILGSFAIVNTVLQAPTGNDTQKGAAEGEGGVTGGSVQHRFNILATRVQTMARSIVTAFAFNFDAKNDMSDVDKQMSIVIAEMSAAKNQGYDNWNDSDSPLSTPFDSFKHNTSNAVAKLQTIRNYIPDTLTDSIAAKAAVDDLISFLNNTGNAAYDAAYNKAMDNGCGTTITGNCDQPDEPNEVIDAFQAVFKEANYKAAFKKASDAVFSNFNSTINQAKMDLKQMFDLVAPITDIADDAFGALVAVDQLKKELTLSVANPLESAGGSLETLENDVKGFSGNTPAKTDKPFASLVASLGDFTKLYNLLKDIQFVDARVTASVVEGNAPLVVNFSSVGSLDPSGLTIDPKQISWDLDGNGQENKGKLENTNVTICDESAVIATTCVYKTPGTYRVRLTIKPSTQTNPATGKTYDKEIGAGIATINIQVNPPQTKINLSLDDGTGSKDIMKYNATTGFLDTNKNSYIVPLSKASTTGITYDATLTKAKDGDIKSQVDQGATVLWDYGNDSTSTSNKTLLPASEGNLHQAAIKYDKEGDYSVSVELTDKNKITDRKLFTLKVAALAPAVDLSNHNVKVGEEVTFDGSNSVSDNGPIKSFAWTVSPNPSITPALLTQESFKWKFDKPGHYDVSLKITDDLGTSEAATDSFDVSSDAPIAQFSFDNADKSQPGTYIFDGGKSFDPDNKDPKQVLDYTWEINGTKLTTKTKQDAADYSYDTANPEKISVKFKKKDTFTVSLVAIDPNGGGSGTAQESLPLEKQVVVDEIIDIAWANVTTDNESAILKVDATTGEGKAAIVQTINSANAVGYLVDFGDGQTEQGDFKNPLQLKHDYKAAGTYVIKMSVFDANDHENNLSRKVFIGSDTQPVAVIKVNVNGQEKVVDPGNPLKVLRTDSLTFDASASKNVDGTGRRLVYSWNLGGELNSKETATKTFPDLGDYKITLSAKNANDLSMKAGTDSIDLMVEGAKPTLKTITAIPNGTSLVAPVSVTINAVGAEDPDGKIVKYRWWYYEPSNTGVELDTIVTTTPNATMIIGTHGEEGKQMEYYFGVELTDNENNTVSSEDIIDPKMTLLAITNGPNKSPVAKFNVDKTNIFEGESVEFTSSSSDPDGTIDGYFWDWEGNGFADNTTDEGSNVTHKFDMAAKDGIKVRLKVVDNNSSTSVSDPVTIYIDSVGVPPVAAFTSAQQDSTKKVDFKNTSTADKDSGVNLTNAVWDFDVNIDSNGDGKKDNDQDATDMDTAMHEYPDFGIYRAKLTVTDSKNQTSMVTNFVNLKAPAAPAPTPTQMTTQIQTPTPAPKPAGPTLDARLLTTPAPSYVDGKIHLKGDKESVVLDFLTSTGDIKKYIIDKNTLFDTNGNGMKDDDEDYVATTPGKWTTDFFKSYGQIRVRLTVVDANGKKDFVDKDIVFDATAGSTYMADIFETEATGIIALLVTIAGFAILALNSKRLKNKNTNGR